MTGAFPPAGGIDQRLGVLDAKAHREGFALQGHPLLVEHGEGVPGAMAHRQHHLLSRNALAVRQLHTAEASAAFHRLKTELTDAAFEANLPSQLRDLAA